MPPAVPALPLDRPRRLAMLAPHPVLRLGVEVVLCQHGGVQVCGSFTREADLLDLLQRQPDGIDLLLIDLLAPYGPEQGLSLLRLLSRRWPLLPVLVLSAHCNASMVTMAMQAGARGFLSKGTTPAMLRRAVEVLARGGRFVPPELRTQLNRSRMRRTPAPVLTPLSRREREVLRLVLQGCTTGEVARRFGRTASTVSTQKRTAYEKLGIHSDGELFRIRHLLECG
ncbi:response regulator [Stenotrophomonas hibiscicola]|uniref:Response regulator transcription factor n=1 Tax=Stenotrophomonas hibiscicola TaxID=86189 RepID=A0ABV0C939_9GAMM|nr:MULTISPECIES: response regulator transcription factor [Stenotrophomonas]EQM72391.1 LuxR family transcriptional regulator [Stenotrophomonas maltophilia MF89]MBA0264865.1 DNA-binding response regulator [Stenotrophomonas maltophilia]MBA0329361.1 DNA-binding response regulator [Stenotrophomonas maltophilia]MBA0469897.1 DNA-binding response regulator [Stenotrophomonas maltophilia]MBA0477638.1 DNA-binding response regulator [Stenotrophomonas maltophilia]